MKIKLKYIVLFFNLIIISELFSQSYDPWFNGFPYRKAITISNAGSAQTNYQVRIDVTYVSGKMNADFSDIRFTTSDGTTLITYWRESYNSSTSAVFWIKLTSIPTGNTTIYMYYGNPNATTLSNGANTFLFFTDWESGTIEGWNILNGGGAGSGSVVLLDGSYQLRLNAPVPDLTNRVQANKSFASSNTGIMIEARLKTGASVGDGVNIGFSDGLMISRNFDEPNNGYYFSLARESNIHTQVRISVAGTFSTLVEISGIIAANTYYLIGLSWLGNELKGWQNRSNVVTASNATYSSQTYAFVSTSLYDKYYDWVFVRKYTSPEPSVLIGAEDALVTKVDSGWGWKVPLNISGSSVALTDFQVKITVSYLIGKINSDFTDIGFTASDGTTLLNFWKESYVAYSSAVFWVKIPSIPTTGTTIYMYYGNPSVLYTSNGINTFDFFDDFDSFNSSLWGRVLTGGTVTYSGSVVTLNNTTGGTVALYTLNRYGSTPFIIETKYQHPSRIRNRLYNTTCSGCVSPTGYDYGIFDPSILWNGVWSGVDLPINTWYIIQWVNTSTNYIWNILNTNYALVFNRSHGSAIANTGYIYFAGTENTSSDLRFDWIRYRKYASPEPAVSLMGSEVVVVSDVEEWFWKVPGTFGYDKIRNGSATDWEWIIFQNNGIGITVPRGSATDWYWGP